MRISDWSSDVCSSDLPRRHCDRCGELHDQRTDMRMAPVELRMQLVALIELLEQSRIMRRVGDFVIEPVRQKIPVHAVTGHLELAPLRPRWLLAEIPPVHGHHGCGLRMPRLHIGRASSRDRVCKYV